LAVDNHLQAGIDSAT